MSESSESGQERVELALPKKSYQDILHEEIRSGWKQLMRPNGGLFLSGLSAGLDIGFSLLLMAVTMSLAGDLLAPLGRKLMLAVMYSVGFVFVNLGQSELFTEHTTLMMYPVLGIVQPEVLGRIATGLVEHAGWVMLVSGMLAGWMMELLSWLVAATHDTISRGCWHTKCCLPWEIVSTGGEASPLSGSRRRWIARSALPEFQGDLQ